MEAQGEYYKLENTKLNWKKYVDLFGLEVLVNVFAIQLYVKFTDLYFLHVMKTTIRI